MNKLLIALAIFVISSISSYALSPENSDSPCWKIAEDERAACWDKEKITGLITQSNYCERDDDCVIANYGCPFGCQSFINIQDDEKLKMITQNYHEQYPQCEYKCAATAKAVICKNKTCQPADSK